MVERIELTDGYSISRVINGSWQLSKGHKLNGQLDLSDIMRAYNVLAEKGFTTFDCADIYTGAEEFLGEFVSQLKNNSALGPHSIQIHTKFVPDINILKDIDFKYTEKIIDRSLKRLRRDELDLVQFHWWDYDIHGCVETARYLQTLKEKGKIRNIAVTNFDTEHLKELVDAGIEIVSCQTQYSLLDRRPEKGFIEYCRSNGILQLCYGTIAGGFLSEKWLDSAIPEIPDNRSQVKYQLIIEESMGWEKYQQLLELLKNIARKHEVGIANVAAKYILNKQGVGAVIIGTRSSRHIASNEKIFAFELFEDDVKKIDAFLEPISIIQGEPFGLERTVGSKFRNSMKMNINATENN